MNPETKNGYPNNTLDITPKGVEEGGAGQRGFVAMKPFLHDVHGIGIQVNDRAVKPVAKKIIQILDSGMDRLVSSQNTMVESLAEKLGDKAMYVFDTEVKLRQKVSDKRSELKEFIDQDPRFVLMKEKIDKHLEPFNNQVKDNARKWGFFLDILVSENKVLQREVKDYKTWLEYTEKYGDTGERTKRYQEEVGLSYPPVIGGVVFESMQFLDQAKESGILGATKDQLINFATLPVVLGAFAFKSQPKKAQAAEILSGMTVAVAGCMGKAATVDQNTVSIEPVTTQVTDTIVTPAEIQSVSLLKLDGYRVTNVNPSNPEDEKLLNWIRESIGSQTDEIELSDLFLKIERPDGQTPFYLINTGNVNGIGFIYSSNEVEPIEGEDYALVLGYTDQLNSSVKITLSDGTAINAPEGSFVVSDRVRGGNGFLLVPNEYGKFSGHLCILDEDGALNACTSAVGPEWTTDGNGILMYVGVSETTIPITNDVPLAPTGTPISVDAPVVTEIPTTVEPAPVSQTPESPWANVNSAEEVIELVTTFNPEMSVRSNDGFLNLKYSSGYEEVINRTRISIDPDLFQQIATEANNKLPDGEFRMVGNRTGELTKEGDSIVASLDFLDVRVVNDDEFKQILDGFKSLKEKDPAFKYSVSLNRQEHLGLTIPSGNGVTIIIRSVNEKIVDPDNDNSVATALIGDGVALPFGITQVNLFLAGNLPGVTSVKSPDWIWDSFDCEWNMDAQRCDSYDSTSLTFSR